MNKAREERRTGVLSRVVNRSLWVIGSFALFVLLAFDPLDIHPLDTWLQTEWGWRGQQTGDASATGKAEELWTCPMHPHVLQHEPGSCPVCGMALVPRRGSSEVAAASAGKSDRPVVAIDPVVLQKMNVRTAAVERRDLREEIRTVGYLEYDQDRMVTVTTKFSGWIETVYVNYIGEPVAEGQPLFEIYSPELVQTERELLSAIEYAERFDSTGTEAGRRAQALVESARERLRYWDISNDQIESLESTGEVFRTLQVVAPASGLVMKRMRGLEGAKVQPGMEVYHIADLRSLWLSAEVFEHQVAQIDVGSEAEIELSSFPGEVFTGTVRLIDPEFSEATRTLRMKIEIANREGRLRAGMFGTVRFSPTTVEDALVVPTQAVLRTGRRNVVVVDLGEGRFEPREVRIGREAPGLVQILSGLAEGETIVTSSQFLIDSESSLQAAVQNLTEGPTGHDGH